MILDMDKLLRRKVDSYLMAWKNNPDRKPLVIKVPIRLERLALLSGLLIGTTIALFKLIS